MCQHINKCNFFYFPLLALRWFRSAKIYSSLNAFVANLKICKFWEVQAQLQSHQRHITKVYLVRISCATLYFGLITNIYCAIPNYNHGVRLIAGQIAILLSQIHMLRVVFSIDMLRQPLLLLIFLSMRSMHIVCMRMYIIFIPLFPLMR